MVSNPPFKAMVLESRFRFCYFETSAALGYWLGNFWLMLIFVD